jgi:hypothetical protein
MSLLDTENPRLVATITTKTIATIFVVWTLLSAAFDVALQGNSYRHIGYLHARRHLVSRPMRKFTAWLRTIAPQSSPKAVKRLETCPSLAS